MKHVKQLIFFFLTTVYAVAGFDFGECSGEGTFQQAIEAYNKDYEHTVLVGEIPQGIKGLYIELISDKDVDIRLYGNNDDKIVHWPRGLLRQSFLETQSYLSTPITYSGYNGINMQKGHEFIKVAGTTPTKLTMKAFGFRAGYATVHYRWSGKEGCTVEASGKGRFTQDIPSKGTVYVGTIPKDIYNLEINLTSEKDIDIQLFGEDGTAIVSWKPKGLLSGANEQSIEYHGMTITWSGYNGVDNQSGHEYIKVLNATTEALTVKVYGYDQGFADVTYTWGMGDDLANKYAIATQGHSSWDNSFSAANVIDNNINTINHTDENENWIQLAFPSVLTMNTIMVQGRTNSHTYRLAGAKVYVLDKPYQSGSILSQDNLVGILKGHGGKQWIFLKKPHQEAQYIVIKGKDGTILHLASVEVYGSIAQKYVDLLNVDLAHTYGTATQGDSQFNEKYNANYVLDGDDTTMNHTGNTTENWLEIEFPSEVKVNKIMIQGRDFHDERLSGAKVYVSQTPYSSGLKESDLVASLLGTADKQWIELPYVKQGKYIIIKAKDGQYLHIRTVETYGMIHEITCSSNDDCGSGVCNTTADKNICAISNVCGNGVIEDGEICDDGNNNNDDGCTVTCKITTGSLGCTQDSDCATSYCNTDLLTNRCEYANTCTSTTLAEGQSCVDMGEYKFSFKVKTSNVMEKNRTANTALRSQLASTGLALPEGGTVNITLSASKAEQTIQLREGPWAGHKTHKLIEGENTITVPKNTTLYFQTVKYDYNASNPVNIALTAIGLVPYPLYKVDQTTDEEWKIMLRNKETDYLELETNRFLITYNRDVIKSYEDTIDFNSLGKVYDEVIEVVERAAGIIPNDPNPLHRPDQNKYHFISSSGHYMLTYNERITYVYTLTERMIKEDKVREFWGIWHEVGHNLQGSGLSWTGQTEVSVNIFAAASLFYRTSLSDVVALYDPHYKKAFETLKTATSYTTLNRQNRELMYHHLFFIFGEKFFHDLHRRYREIIHNPSLDADFDITDSEKQMNTMAIMVSKLRHKNMIAFFDFWKFPLTQATKDKINALGYSVLNNFERLPSELTKGRPATDFDMRF